LPGPRCECYHGRFGDRSGAPPATAGEQHEMNDLTPREIVRELDRYIIGQEEAKRAVAIAIRNRWRRLRLSRELRNDVCPIGAMRFDGVRYDIGTKLDFIKTNVAFGLQRPDIADGLREYLRSIVGQQ